MLQGLQFIELKCTIEACEKPWDRSKFGEFHQNMVFQEFHHYVYQTMISSKDK